jgi:hypothetical protein
VFSLAGAFREVDAEQLGPNFPKFGLYRPNRWGIEFWSWSPDERGERHEVVRPDPDGVDDPDLLTDLAEVVDGPRPNANLIGGLTNSERQPL